MFYNSLIEIKSDSQYSERETGKIFSDWNGILKNNVNEHW